MPSNIDQAGIEELQNLITLTRAEFDKTLLTNAVESLSSAVQEQRLWIEGMKEKRDQLTAKIRRLRTVQGQLRST